MRLEVSGRMFRKSEPLYIESYRQGYDPGRSSNVIVFPSEPSRNWGSLIMTASLIVVIGSILAKFFIYFL